VYRAESWPNRLPRRVPSIPRSMTGSSSPYKAACQSKPVMKRSAPLALVGLQAATRTKRVPMPESLRLPIRLPGDSPSLHGSLSSLGCPCPCILPALSSRTGQLGAVCRPARNGPGDQRNDGLVILLVGARSEFRSTPHLCRRDTAASCPNPGSRLSVYDVASSAGRT
jgi:hypothetical protein